MGDFQNTARATFRNTIGKYNDAQCYVVDKVMRGPSRENTRNFYRRTQNDDIQR